MNRPARLLVGAALALAAGCASESSSRDERPAPVARLPSPFASGPTPHWIWRSAIARDGEELTLLRRFELDRLPRSAVLAATCDDAFELYVNGERVSASEAWETPLEVDVTALLVVGTNALEARCRNVAGPAGFVASLGIDDGPNPRHLVSDESWTLASGVAARVVGDLGGQPWGPLPPAVAPEELAGDKAAIEASPPDPLPDGDELEVAAGYAVELVYTVPRATEGSWISLVFDDAGRALVGRESGGILRVRFRSEPAGLPRVDVVETIDDTIGAPHGLEVVGTSLYAVAHPRDELPGGLYRFTDLDDTSVRRELLFALEGSGEHGPHAVRFDPLANELVLAAGNHTPLPLLASSRVPLHWAEDQAWPRRGDPGGHAVDVLAPGGWVARIGLDGRGFELVACGLRNAYDLDFGPHGELFTYDSDMEWDLGLAWYRPPRILRVASGADFGWRHGSGKWPEDWPDTWPAVVATDLASPTGVVSGARGRLGPRDANALLVGDWAFGRVLAIDLATRGAGWSGSVRELVRGAPLPVTDLAFGPDGALWFTTGGRNAHSGLYRLRADASPPAAPTPVPQLDSGARARRYLESLHAAPDAAAVELAWPMLDHPEREVRAAARVVLELVEPQIWSARALAEPRLRARLEALLALARVDARRYRTELETALLDLPLPELTPTQRVHLLRLATLVDLRAADAGGGLSRTTRTRLLDGFWEQNATRPGGLTGATARELFRLAVRCGDARALDFGLTRLETATTTTEASHWALGLVHLDEALDATSSARYRAGLARLRTLQGGTRGASFEGYLSDVEADLDARLGGATTSSARPAPPVAALPPARSFVRAWTTTEALRAVDALAGDADPERGRTLFAAASCQTCHARGGSVALLASGASAADAGPDLTGVGARFGRRELFEAVLEPSKVIPDRYADTEVWTTDDELFVGRLLASGEDRIRLRTQAPERALVEIERQDVSELRPHPLSRMPEGLLDTLDASELRDLLAFLRGE